VADNESALSLRAGGPRLSGRCETTPERVVEALSLTSAHRADSLDAPVAVDDNQLPRLATLAHDEPGYLEAERAADIDRLLSRLAAREQAIVRLRFHHDLTQREIADRVGLSQMHVSRLLRSALDELRGLVEQEGRSAAGARVPRRATRQGIATDGLPGTAVRARRAGN
jgi:RNA polymerase sigma-B factor